MTDPQALLAEQAAEVVGKLTAGECLSLADKLEGVYSKWNPASSTEGAGGAFATMCLMSDALRLLGIADSLVGNKLSVAEIASALRERAILIERQGK